MEKIKKSKKTTLLSAYPNPPRKQEQNPNKSLKTKLLRQNKSKKNELFFHPRKKHRPSKQRTRKTIK
ncbi:hypothetical protein [Bergeyella sp. RCAD1439]|uniref:hypothetical protein n=1 Tax=Bergeyella anatis TaxID=3113737 RepID=UPI002E16EDC9|nr:hypothetical protein [Bergeyella sp. RCAD1439]